MLVTVPRTWICLKSMSSTHHQYHQLHNTNTDIGSNGSLTSCSFYRMSWILLKSMRYI